MSLCSFNTINHNTNTTHFISPHLPCSNVGDAMGDNSMLKNMIPSFGRLSLGATSSQDTWAITLHRAVCLQPAVTKCTIHWRQTYIYLWNGNARLTAQKLLCEEKDECQCKDFTWFSPDPQSSIHSQHQTWSLSSYSHMSAVHPGAAGKHRTGEWTKGEHQTELFVVLHWDTWWTALPNNIGNVRQTAHLFLLDGFK